MRAMGLFQKRFEGDDSLLELARLRFREAGLGTEFYAGTPEELEWLLRFNPFPEEPSVVHLGREIDLFEEEGRGLVREFAGRFSARIYGFVVHDQPDAASRPDEYAASLRELAPALGGPYIFIEYAVGLDLRQYIELFRTMRETERVSACVDTGHIGLRHVRDAYGSLHHGEDVFSLDDDRLKEVIGDVEGAVRSALPVVLTTIRVLGRMGKPVHIHLHDGHPLCSSPYRGLSDHFSFLDSLPIPFEYRGRQSVELMFGLSGLREIASTAIEALGPEGVSFTIEVHPSGGKLPLGNASGLFAHWTDSTNAELMNHWLYVLQENQKLLLEACRGRGEQA